MSKVLLDTNVLIYSIDEESKYFKKAQNLISEQNIDLFTTSKNLSEFLAVITRFPGNSLTLENALTVLQDFKTIFTILYPNEKSYKIFIDLLKKYEFPGDTTPVIRASALKALENPSDETASKPVMDLLKTLDEYIPEPVRALDKPFLMPVEDVFSIEGRGTVVIGRIERGMVKVGEEVAIIGMSPEVKKTTITGVEMFNKTLQQGQAGDNAGLLLRGTKKEEVERGMVLAKAGSITPHTEFEAQVYALTKEEGGRHKPFFTGYKPQFYIRTTDVTGDVTLPAGTEMVMPGDTCNLTIKLIVPVAMEEQMRFAIREGGRTVGAGAVTKIIK